MHSIAMHHTTVIAVVRMSDCLSVCDMLVLYQIEASYHCKIFTETTDFCQITFNIFVSYSVLSIDFIRLLDLLGYLYGASDIGNWRPSKCV